MPGLSYALMRNYSTGGLKCELFFSHAWDEGVFELIDNALAAWPEELSGDEHGAYICCLSNPQNLDITELLNHPDGSPFERILDSGVVSDFIMLANSNTPIHTRLWCVLEAYKAVQRRIRRVGVSGEPVQLLSGALAERLRGVEQAAREQRGRERAAIDDEYERCLNAPELLGDAQAIAEQLQRQHPHLAEYHKAEAKLAQAKLDVLNATDAQLLDLSQAHCSFQDDESMIREVIEGCEGEIVQLVVGLIRSAVCGVGRVAAGEGVAPRSLGLSLVDESVDVTRLPKLDGPLFLLQFARWLRLRPQVRRLRVCASTLDVRGTQLLRSALDEGLLPALQAIDVAEDDANDELRALAASAREAAASQQRGSAASTAEGQRPRPSRRWTCTASDMGAHRSVAIGGAAGGAQPTTTAGRAVDSLGLVALGRRLRMWIPRGPVSRPIMREHQGAELLEPVEQQSGALRSAARASVARASMSTDKV